MTDGLVTKIGRIVKESQISRRDFLKIAGAASAVGVTGCADSPKQSIFPHVHGDASQVPGVSVWYRSTCTECAAGCGIQVRTREGRAVKIEGSRDNPINKGGLCAVGQAALQDLYDPDRVREPLEKTKQGDKIVWKPIEWEKAYERIATVLASKTAKKGFFTGEYTGALSELLSDWCEANGVKHVSYDPMAPVSESKASELVYGSYGIPQYSFDKADVVVNFGADFLETWVSPCEFARDWAKSRKSANPARVFHIEPRLSLTGSNADTWIRSAPGSDLQVALSVLKLLVERGKGEGSEAYAAAKSLTATVSLDKVVEESGITKSQILLMADELARAKHSLVLSGGTAADSSSAVTLHVVTALCNVLLGNVGKTVDISRMRKYQSKGDNVEAFFKDMQSTQYGLFLVDRSNPIFALPKSLNLATALGQTKLVVSFSNKLDETAQFADLILPTNTSLESWGDVRVVPGVNSLIQPSMTPVFNTRSLGDILIDFANGMKQSDSFGKAKDFKDYLQASWKKVHASSGVSIAFEKFWEESVERGGFFKEVSGSQSARVDGKVGSLKVEEATFNTNGAGEGALVVYPFTSVKSFDGRAANRPWLLELPDPLTQILWDSWAELHPETAKAHGLVQGDVVTIRNDAGEINVPVYVTEYVHRNIVAVPLGMGHKSFGRYAEQVPEANVWALLPSFNLLGAKASISRSRLKTDLVHQDGSRSQMGREIARTKMISDASDLAHEDHAAKAHGHHGEEVDMYKQREHPLYHWAMAIDLAACTGCSACVVACFAENNIQMVGKELARQGREMAWMRIDRYFEGGENEELVVHMMPMMCQHCGNAPCEPVCPVYATYHNEEGLNAMIYNRCVGTRYCANNCSYKVRHFNWFEYDTPEPLNWQFNPDVQVRGVGVMEKCSFCSHRIAEAKDRAKDLGRPVLDGEVTPACVQSCPTEALVFGNLNDKSSLVYKLSQSKRGYKVLDEHINTKPSVTYLEDIKYKNI